MLFLSNLSLPVLAGLLGGLLVGITFHEFSHAFVADQLGDHRVRALGRVSLNPLRHLDPLGTALMVLVGIGWGKPVPVAVESLRSGRNGLAMVGAAGPFANVVVALGFAADLPSRRPDPGRWRCALPGAPVPVLRGVDQPAARDPEHHPHPAPRRVSRS